MLVGDIYCLLEGTISSVNDESKHHFISMDFKVNHSLKHSMCF